MLASSFSSVCICFGALAANRDLLQSGPLAGIHMEIVIFFFAKRKPQSEPYTILVLSEFKNGNQVKRIISTGKLNILLHLHFQPINVVVFDDP